MKKQPSLLRLVGTILLCLQLMGQCDANIRNLFSFGRGNNNLDERKKQTQQRRRLMEEGNNNNNNGGGAIGRADVHIDAATGTVPHIVSADVKARESLAQTCDGQMAAALVRANQLATVAEQERDSAIAQQLAAADAVTDLEGTITTLRAELEKEKLDHKQDVQSAAQLLHQTKEAASQSLLEAKEVGKTLVDESKQRARQVIEDLKVEHSKLLQIRKEEAETKLESVITEKDEIIASLQSKLTLTSDDLQRKLQEEVDKVRTDRDSRLAALKEKMDERVAALEAKMVEAAADAARTLQTTKEEAKAYMLSQVSAVTDELVQIKVENEKSLNTKNEKIKNLEDYTKKMMEKKADIEHTLHEAMLELQHWRTLHANRTYCNMTHIQADLYSATVGVHNHGVQVAHQIYGESQKYASQANQQLRKGLTHASEVYQDQVEKYWPVIKPHYDEYVVGNYRKYVEPQINKHVHPIVTQLSTWYKDEITPRLVQFGKDFERNYANLIQLFGQHCKASLKEFRKATRNSQFLKDHPPPQSLMRIWGESCAHPQESVGLVFRGLLLLLGIVFYRQLWGLFVWVLSWGVALILIFTPMGLIISRRQLFSKKDTPTITTSLSDGAKESEYEPGSVPDPAPSSNGNKGTTTKSSTNGAKLKKTT